MQRGALVTGSGIIAGDAQGNADARYRTCLDCGKVHDQAELGDIAWDAVADALGAPIG